MTHRLIPVDPQDSTSLLTDPPFAILISTVQCWQKFMDTEVMENGAVLSAFHLP
jgi:hypothetical protein